MWSFSNLQTSQLLKSLNQSRNSFNIKKISQGYTLKCFMCGTTSCTQKLRAVCHRLIINREEGRRQNCKEITTFSTELFHTKRETVSCWKKYFCETQMPCCSSNDEAVEPERWMDSHWRFLLTTISTRAERFLDFPGITFTRLNWTKCTLCKSLNIMKTGSSKKGFPCTRSNRSKHSYIT